jgi:cytochrome c-type biogenesis protein
MALYLAGSQLLRTPRLYPEARFQVSDRFGMFTAPIAGAAFAFGWSPCLGPVIAAVFGVAATQSGLRSIALLIAYSLGMGVSFLLVGLAFGRWATPLDFVKRHLRTITFLSAGVLAVFGLLLMFDRLWWLTAQFTNFLDSLGLNSFVELG